MRELKKLKISRISIVASGANKESFMIRKSIDYEKEDVDISDYFPLLVPSDLIEKMEKEEEEIAQDKADYEDRKTSEDDIFPSFPLVVPQHLIEKMLPEDDDEDEDDE